MATAKCPTSRSTRELTSHVAGVVKFKALELVGSWHLLAQAAGTDSVGLRSPGARFRKLLVDQGKQNRRDPKQKRSEK